MIKYIYDQLPGLVLGLVVAYLTYIRTKPNPEPLAIIKAEQALTWTDQEKVPDFVEIYIDKQRVPHVARAMVRFWNDGYATLGKERIPEHDKLRLALENGGRFLAVKILKYSNATCLCKIEIDKTNPAEAIIDFDFLDKDDGMIISVFHTDPKAMPLIKGTVKGSKVKVIEEVIRKPLKGHDRWLQPLLTVVFPAFAGLVLMAFALWPTNQTDLLRALLLGCYPGESNEYSFNYRIWNGVVGSIFLLFAAWELWDKRRRYPKALTWEKP